MQGDRILYQFISYLSRTHAVSSYLPRRAFFDPQPAIDRAQNNPYRTRDISTPTTFKTSCFQQDTNRMTRSILPCTIRKPQLTQAHSSNLIKQNQIDNKGPRNIRHRKKPHPYATTARNIATPRSRTRGFGTLGRSSPII